MKRKRAPFEEEANSDAKEPAKVARLGCRWSSGGQCVVPLELAAADISVHLGALQLETGLIQDLNVIIADYAHETYPRQWTSLNYPDDRETTHTWCLMKNLFDLTTRYDAAAGRRYGGTSWVSTETLHNWLTCGHECLDQYDRSRQDIEELRHHLFCCLTYQAQKGIIRGRSVISDTCTLYFPDHHSSKINALSPAFYVQLFDQTG